jgi:hypothetical protein
MDGTVHRRLVIDGEGAGGRLRPLQHGPGPGHAGRVGEQVDALTAAITSGLR